MENKYAPRSKQEAKGQKKQRVPTTTVPAMAMAMAPMAAARSVGDPHIGRAVERRSGRLTATPRGSGCGGYFCGTARRRPRERVPTCTCVRALRAHTPGGSPSPAAMRAAARRGRPRVPSLPWSAMASPPPPLRGYSPPFGSPPPSPPGGGRASLALRRLDALDGPPPPTDAAVMKTNDDAAASKASAMAMCVIGLRFWCGRAWVKVK